MTTTGLLFLGWCLGMSQAYVLLKYATWRLKGKSSALEQELVDAYAKNFGVTREEGETFAQLHVRSMAKAAGDNRRLVQFVAFRSSGSDAVN